MVKHEITVDNLKKVFTFLDTKNADAPAYVMEALVGLMRKKQKADIKSVELYTKTYEGFSIGLSRLRLEELEYDHCAYHSEQIKKWSSTIQQPQFQFFMPYYRLLEETVKHASFASEIVQNKREKAELEERIHQNSKEIERLELHLKNDDVEQVLREDLETYKNQQVPFFAERKNTVSKSYHAARA